MRSDNKRIIHCALLLASLFLTACGGGGTTQPATPAYYVSPSGSDANQGSSAQPWQTLTYAVGKLKAGDTLYARAGVYAETVKVVNSGTTTSPIMITAYPGESPIIDATGLTLTAYPSILTLQGNYIHALGFEIRNINLDGAVAGGYGVSILGANDIVSNMIVHHTWAQGIIAQGDYSIIEDNQVYRVALANCRLSSPSACGITATTYGSALYSGGGWPSCVSAARDLVNGITDNAILRRNTVHDCWGEGVSTWFANGTIIEDNISYDNWAQNLYVNNASNVLIQRNIVYNTPNNYVQAIAGITLADEQPTSLSANNTFINNFVYNAHFCAFCWTFVANTGLTNVLIANNTMAGFSTGSSLSSPSVVNTNSSIRNNIVTGAVTVPSAAGLTFSNNLWAAPPANASSSSDVIGNPQLAATGNTGPGQLSAGYFKLLATSPAIRKGMALPQVTTDFFGTPRKAAPDIGGDEQ